MPIQRLDHGSIRTIRLAETQAFYESVMGFAVASPPTLPVFGRDLPQTLTLWPRLHGRRGPGGGPGSGGAG